jgi:hypothetical protein
MNFKFQNPYLCRSGEAASRRQANIKSMSNFQCQESMISKFAIYSFGVHLKFWLYHLKLDFKDQ